MWNKKLLKLRKTLSQKEPIKAYCCTQSIKNHKAHSAKQSIGKLSFIKLSFKVYKELKD